MPAEPFARNLARSAGTRSMPASINLLIEVSISLVIQFHVLDGESVN